VGELHDVAGHAPILEQLFQEYDWTFELGEPGDNQSMFWACSPAALPLLPSMASAKTRSLKMA